MDKPATIITFYFQKGGVAKTTSAVNIAACTATKINNVTKKKNRVLIIDFDSQASATKHFDCYNENQDNMYDVLKGTADIRDIIIHKEFDYGKDGKCLIDIAPSTEMMHNVEDQYYSLEYPDARLSLALEPIIFNYDYIFIDSPPEKDCLYKNAFNVTDYFVLATEIMPITKERIIQTVSMIDELTTMNEPGIILGFCINKYSPNLSVDLLNKKKQKDYISEYEKYFPVFENKIPNSSAISTAFVHHIPIPFLHRKKHKCKEVCSLYMKLTDEILDKIAEEESQKGI